MASDLRTQIVPAPTGGHDTETSPGQLPTNRARLVQNFLTGRPGKSVVRGPMRITKNAHNTAGTAISMSGGWIFDDKILIVNSGTTPKGYWTVDMSNLSMTAAVNPVGLDRDLYPNHARAFNYVYGFYIPSGVSRYHRRLVNGWTSDEDAILVRWDGAGLVGSFVPYTVNNHPTGGRDLVFHLGRLWVLGGSTPGFAAPTFSTRLFYSQDVSNVMLPDTLAAWQTGGVANEIILDGSDTDYGVALSTINGRLVILRRQSVYMMTGTSPENFSVRKISNTGCVDGDSVLEWDDGIFFLSDQGLVFFDGSTVEEVSGPIHTELMAEIYYSAGLARHLKLARIGAEHFIMCTWATSNNSTAAWVYHVPSKTWSRFYANSNVLSPTGVPQNVFRTANWPVAFDGAWFHDLSLVANPEKAAPAEAGRDKLAASPFTDYLIPAEIVTRHFKLGTPEAKAYLARMFMEHTLKATANVSTGTIEWQIDIEDDRGNVIVSNLTFAGDYSPGEPTGARLLPKPISSLRDVRYEVERIRLRITLNAASPSWPQSAEIFDAGLEYQVGQDRG